MNATKTVDAVVFDMDGVLIDSEDIWLEVREEFAASIGAKWRAEDQVATMGCNTAAWSRIMVERLDLRARVGMDEDGVAREIIGRMAAKYEQRLPQREGAVDAVRRAAARWPLGLASGSPRALGDVVLAVTGLERVFAATIYGDEVANGKPAPDMYLKVLERMGVAPARAVGVEDSGNGIRSLAAAGMGIVAAPGPGYPLSAEVLALAGACIESMTQLDAGVVERAAAARSR